ncbi:unnamed protein product [marine sediment metagenome]|uniref:Uncharacterized protein n=1 Tax=marine sediment metagenome TaxID=412755 RepID=X1R4D2_9ZZZZ
MAIQSFQLDPNAQAYTDDEIVGKVNTATDKITRSLAVSSPAVDLSGKDTDDLPEGTVAKYDTGVPPSDLDALPDGTVRKIMSDAEKTKLADIEENAKDDQIGDEIVTAINGGASAITREDALDQDSLKIVKTNPVTGEFRVKNIHRQLDGKLDIEYEDTPEP